MRVMGKRGPPPKQLIKLYYMLNENPSISNKKIAKRLGVSLRKVYDYKYRLKKKLGDITKFCPECLEETIIYDQKRGEYVCRKCGLVVDSLFFSNNLPFGSEESPNTFALTSHIAFGKSLGDTMPWKYLYRVLARVNDENGREDKLPVRQIQVLTETFDPPLVKSMLNYGSRLLKRLGFDGDTERNHVFADEYGRLLRKLAAFLMVGKLKVKPYLVARAALYYLLSKADGSKAEEVKQRFPFGEKHLRIVSLLYNATTP